MTYAEVKIMDAVIRPSADLRNHYSDISKQCREERTPVIITVNGRGDTAVLGLQDYYQMKAELELLRNLAESEDDVRERRVGSMQDSFDDIRATLMTRKNA
jgi:prevent-host-death family protein